MSTRTCEHIQDDGLRCPNAAMYRRQVCYYHWRLHRPSAPVADPAYVPPIFDSEASITITTAHILRSVLAGKIDIRRAQVAMSCVREGAKSLRLQGRVGDHAETSFTAFMADYYSALDEIQAKSSAAYPDPQPLIYPAHFADVPEDDEPPAAANVATDKQNRRLEEVVGMAGKDLDTKANHAGKETNDVATRVKDVSKETSDVVCKDLMSVGQVMELKKEANYVGTGAPARPARAQLAVLTAPAEEASTATPTLSSRAPLLGEGSASPHSTTDAPTDQKASLSATQLNQLKKILRRGRSHPQFQQATRLLDRHIAATSG